MPSLGQSLRSVHLPLLEGLLQDVVSGVISAQLPTQGTPEALHRSGAASSNLTHTEAKPHPQRTALP